MQFFADNCLYNIDNFVYNTTIDFIIWQYFFIERGRFLHENHGSTSRSDFRALRVPFKTALRSVSSVEDVIVEIHTDTGAVGYGEAPPTGVITGDTTGAIIGAIRDHIAKTIIGRDVDDFEDLMIALNACIQKNTSAKAAVDMALWDLYGQLYKIPVYKLMGGAKKSIVTDITISVNDPEEMVRDALNAIDRGYDCLKVKVGKEPEKDIARLSAIRGAVPKETCIRIDANQGWTPRKPCAS